MEIDALKVSIINSIFDECTKMFFHFVFFFQVFNENCPLIEKKTNCFVQNKRGVTNNKRLFYVKIHFFENTLAKLNLKKQCQTHRIDRQKRHIHAKYLYRMLRTQLLAMPRGLCECSSSILYNVRHILLIQLMYTVYSKQLSHQQHFSKANRKREKKKYCYAFWLSLFECCFCFCCWFCCGCRCQVLFDKYAQWLTIISWVLTILNTLALCSGEKINSERMRKIQIQTHTHIKREKDRKRTIHSRTSLLFPNLVDNSKSQATMS